VQPLEQLLERRRAGRGLVCRLTRFFERPPRIRMILGYTGPQHTPHKLGGGLVALRAVRGSITPARRRLVRLKIEIFGLHDVAGQQSPRALGEQLRDLLVAFLA